MPTGLLGLKVGMSQVFDETGAVVPVTVLKAGDRDCDVTVHTHDLTGRQRHGGRKGELIDYSLGRGTRAHFYCEIGEAAVIDELKLSVWVRADRPGIALLARALFPREVDPDTGKPRFALLSGQVYDRPGRWQELVLGNVARQITRRQAVFRMELGRREFDVRGAYIDRLVLNGYCGPGRIRFYSSDLTAEYVHLNADYHT